MATSAPRDNLVYDVKAARKRLGMTQDQLAAALGMKHARSLTRWEHEGVRPSQPYIDKIEELLKRKFEGTRVERPMSRPALRTITADGVLPVEAIGIMPGSLAEM